MPAKSHGQSRTPEYQVWQNMLQRCFNPNSPIFADYGGRGITVCDRWLDSFENFIGDMGPRPFPGAEIDRENNDGNYEPGNCRWVGRVANCDNKRSARRITHGGRTMSVTAWARELSIPRSSLDRRVRAGWSDTDAITKPFKRKVA